MLNRSNCTIMIVQISAMQVTLQKSLLKKRKNTILNQLKREKNFSPWVSKIGSLPPGSSSISLNLQLTIFIPLTFFLFEDFLTFLKAQLYADATVAKSLQSYPTLCDPIDGNPPGSPVPGILQARTLFSSVTPKYVWGFLYQQVIQSQLGPPQSNLILTLPTQRRCQIL